MNENQIVNKLKTIGSKGSVKDLNFLFECLLSKDESVVKKSQSILIDVKDNKAKNIIIEKLNDSNYFNVRSIIVGICWQSGLDFSNDISLFFNIIAKEELTVAIEAMSVVENIVTANKVDKELMKSGLLLLGKSITNSKDEVKNLLISNIY